MAVVATRSVSGQRSATETVRCEAPGYVTMHAATGEAPVTPREMRRRKRAFCRLIFDPMVRASSSASTACSRTRVGQPTTQGSDRLWRHFLDNTGTVTVADDHVRIDLALRTYTPVLIDAGFPELDIPIGWWGGRSLRFGFPPR